MTEAERISLEGVKRDVQELRGEVSELKDATKELVDAWKAAGSLVRFVKWASTFVTAVGILWVAISHFWPAR